MVEARRAGGDRLRLERERLGFAPVALAALGGQSLNSQLAYEAGRRSPDADYLRAIATTGADIAYIVMGLRSLDSSAVNQLSRRRVEAVEAAWHLIVKKPHFWPDQEVRRALISWHREMPVRRLQEMLAAQFGPGRVPPKSSIHRFWIALDQFWRAQP
ncbi:helix-turn-helix domain-containing protein [Sphingomonas sp. SRS2]|uniref:helix-turn-helix domain-containing protein n=1 Tax=Sphingomonas sp. SRS2 TaxID=133190 RepID=UPI00128C45AF|nr:helix-turn-helix transcriptional regulator [Sphingomonas sp. SRS2]